MCCRQKGGREVVTGEHYTTCQSSESAQLVIHSATQHDSGTYTALVTNHDGTQVSSGLQGGRVSLVDSKLFIITDAHKMTNLQ